MKKRNKNILILSFLLTSFSLCSCGNKQLKKDGIVNVELVGELTHIQYWDYNDNWDLESLTLIINYDDNTTEILKGNDESIHCTFNPASPEGLDHSITSFEIVEGYYEDYKGRKYQIEPRVFTGISIVDYNYSNPASPEESSVKDGQKATSLKTIFVFCGVLALGILFFYFLLMNKKRNS